MIGIVVTGHGNFATGLTSSLRLLAGEPEHYEAVDFEPEDSIESLTEKIKKAVERLKDCESIVIFADLTGGSPFNVASRLKMAGAGCPIEVVGGTNIPILLGAYMSRMMTDDVTELVTNALEDGKEQIVRFMPIEDDDDECECEEYEE